MRKVLFGMILGMILLSVLLLACGGSPSLPDRSLPDDSQAASEDQIVRDIDQQMTQLDTEAIDTAELDAMAAELDLSDI